MYIQRTTCTDRRILEDYLDGAFLQIEQAEILLCDLTNCFFSGREQKVLSKSDAQAISVNLRIAEDLLYGAQLAYHLHAGHGDEPCVQRYLEEAALARANVDDARKEP